MGTKLLVWARVALEVVTNKAWARIAMGTGRACNEFTKNRGRRSAEVANSVGPHARHIVES